jgi:hypothetical protein
MIKILLVSLLLSSAIVLAILGWSATHTISIAKSYYTLALSTNSRPSAVSIAGDRVCYLYMYDIAYQTAPRPAIPSDLYKHETSISQLVLSTVTIAASFSSTGGNSSARIFEVTKPLSIDLQRIIRTELARSNYSQYLPIVSGDGYQQVIGRAEQKAVSMASCAQGGPHAPPTFFLCKVSTMPAVGNVHVVEVCLDRATQVKPPTPSLGATRIDKLIDMVANASRYGTPDPLLKEISISLNIDLSAQAMVSENIVLQPRLEHLLRVLALLAVFSSGLFLHYRLCPHEYAGFTRLVKRIRRLIYRR